MNEWSRSVVPSLESAQTNSDIGVPVFERVDREVTIRKFHRNIGAKLLAGRSGIKKLSEIRWILVFYFLLISGERSAINSACEFFQTLIPPVLKFFAHRYDETFLKVSYGDSSVD